jgi:hypothetical protein
MFRVRVLESTPYQAAFAEQMSRSKHQDVSMNILQLKMLRREEGGMLYPMYIMPCLAPCVNPEPLQCNSLLLVCPTNKVRKAALGMGIS